jgi:hypothetical protein
MIKVTNFASFCGAFGSLGLRVGPELAQGNELKTTPSGLLFVIS